jgi:hypothetical protein
MASIQLAVWFSSFGAFSLLSQRLISLVWLSQQLSSQSQQLCQHSFVGIRFFG